jgi:hypothetical protein
MNKRVLPHFGLTADRGHGQTIILIMHQHLKLSLLKFRSRHSDMNDGHLMSLDNTAAECAGKSATPGLTDLPTRGQSTMVLQLGIRHA